MKTPLYTIEPDGCWIFARRSRMANGYGIIRRDGRSQPAHRYFYEQKHGPVPAGMQLDHLCRRRDCVNPAHLEPVTHAENGRRGAATKLDWPRVRQIRALASAGWLHADIAAAFAVAPNTVTGIARGRRWANGGGGAW